MNLERILMVLKQPHVSEKSSVLADKLKQFVFKVVNNATKQEVKAAVEQMFKVKVKHVNVVNMNGKTKRFRNKAGKRSDWKKAYVTLHDNFDIKFTAVE